MCKDVAMFVNADGGCLVLGFEDQRDPTNGESIAGAVSPILVSAVNLDRYRDLIEHWIYPPPSGVEFRWFSDGTPPKGVLLINIRSVEAEQPYVMRRIVTESGEKIHALGIPKRNGDHAVWHLAERVHHLLRQADRADSVRALPVRPPEDAEHPKQRVMEIQEWDEDKPIYWLQAVPIGGRSPLTHFYDEVRQALEHPASLRGSGFNLRLSLQADVIEGSLFSHLGDTAVWISPDGMLTLGVLGPPGRLGWAVNNPPSSAPWRINSIVLVEMTLEFCRFVSSVLRDRAAADRWTLSMDCQRFRQSQIYLAGGPTSQMQIPPAVPQIASADSWRREIVGTSDPEVDAFDLLKYVYGLFGLPEGDIPYSDGTRVLAERVSQL